MATATGRFPDESLPRLVSEGAEAPEFPVTFSRRPEASGRSDAVANSFRWFGKGTVRLLERGLLVNAKRRLAIGFHTTEQRVVPAWEICDVYREGNSVCVSLRGDPRNRDFFQFWTVDAATAGTIVRLLPTERTIEIEYVESPTEAKSQPSATAPVRRWHRPSAITMIAAALMVASTVTLITIVKLRGHTAPHATEALATRPATTAKARPATTAEIANARLTMRRYDERMNSLRAEFNMAFSALQYGDLSKEDFIEGANRWLIPQWRALYSQLAPNLGNDLDAAVRRRLITATLGWEGGLREYARGLNEQNYHTVLGALGQISAANDAQRDAWRLIPSDEP